MALESPVASVEALVASWRRLASQVDVTEARSRVHAIVGLPVDSRGPWATVFRALLLAAQSEEIDLLAAALAVWSSRITGPNEPPSMPFGERRLFDTVREALAAKLADAASISVETATRDVARALEDASAAARASGRAP